MGDIFYMTAIRALNSLPKEFRDRLTGVEIMVEDFADTGTLESLGINSPWNLLGLYSGLPMDKQSIFYQSPFPERIVLYKKPIMMLSKDNNSLYRTIRRVLLHEIGHHFGFDDKALEKMEGHGS